MVEWRRCERRVPGSSRGEFRGDICWEASKFCIDFRGRTVFVTLSFRSIWGGLSTWESDAIIGTARAKGDETEDGVDERVCNDIPCHANVTGGGRGCGADEIKEKAFSVVAAAGIGGVEAKGVGSREVPCPPPKAYSEVVLDRSSSPCRCSS